MKFVKNNNKGFMLVEVIIVTVIVVSIMTILYLAFNRVYNVYENKAKYTNIDAIYALKTIEDYMIDEMKLTKFISDYGNSYYVEIECSNENAFFNQIYCESIFTQYNINKMFLLKKRSDNTLNLSSDVNQTFKDYITYLNNAVINNETSSHLFVVETNTLESDNTILNKYAYLEIK